MNASIRNIQPGNKALEYIECRILDDNYRGTESSEHNRYDMQEIQNNEAQKISDKQIQKYN